MLLLDTCALIWLAAGGTQLSLQARVRVEQEPLFISAISAWELGLKCKQGKLSLPSPPEVWYPAVLAHHGISELPVTGLVGLAASSLPRHHNDPADRFIIATAMRENLIIVTPDHHIRRYSQVNVVW